VEIRTTTQHNTQIFFCFSAHLDAARISRRGRRGPDDYFTSATFMLLFTKRRRPGGRAATRPSVGLTTLLFYFATTAPPPGRRPTHGRLLTGSLTHGCFSRTSSDKHVDDDEKSRRGERVNRKKMSRAARRRSDAAAWKT